MEMKIESTEKFIEALKTFLILTDDSDISESEDEAELANDGWSLFIFFEYILFNIPSDRLKRISKSISNSSFEQHIRFIGNHWNELVKWVQMRYNGLQKTLLSWRHFEEEIQGIFEWLEERICTADQLLRKSSRNQFNVRL